MTSRNRKPKDTRSRSESRAVRKGKDAKAADAAASGVCEAPNQASSAASVTTRAGEVRRQLAAHVDSLRFVNGTLSVCVQALQQQNADMDAEIAIVIQRTAGDKLDATIDLIEELAYGLELQEVA